MSEDSPDRTRAIGAAVLIAAAAALAFLYFRGTAVELVDEDADADADERVSEEAQRRDPRGEPKESRTGRSSTLSPSPSPPLRLSPAETVSDRATRYGDLAGRVISWSNGAPIPRAELTFVASGRSSSIRSSADGSFAFHASLEGPHTLSLVTADGFHPYAPEWDTSPLTFHATAGQRVQGIVVYLVPAVAYAGVVRGADGEPVAGAQVELIDRGDAERALVPLDETVWESAADGTFTFHAPDGALLEARHAELGRGRARVDFGAQASRRLEITLSTDAAPDQLGARIEGEVHVADGTPLPGVAVFANPRPDNPANPAEQLHPSGQSTTDEQGRFSIDGLDVGPHRLFARARGHAAARQGAEAPSAGIILVLGREAALEGTVTDAETGAPLASSTVIVERVLGPLARQIAATTTTFGSDGRFVVRGVSAGSYEITATAHGYAANEPRPIMVDPDGVTDVTLSLGRGATFRGVVVSAEAGPPIADARVSLEGQLGALNSAVPILVSAMTADDGRFTLTGVPPGDRSLFVAAEGHHGRVISGLSATAGSTRDITIDLTPTEDGEEPRIELVGIGCVLSARGDGLIIGQVIDGGGAAEAGLVPDDVILAVDGVPITDLGFGGAIGRIRGREGSRLTLRVRRANGGAEEEFVVTRRRIRA